ncbi:cntA Carnitine monooxygenase oxygenase subunit [Candida maltosa Xu316]
MTPPTLAQLPTQAPQLDAIPIDKNVARKHTLPAKFWTSDEVFEFEKRAIFHKSWMYCTHTSRFEKSGDYYSFNISDGSVKAFHNVCRHRAYPVVRKDKGSSNVLACHYHRWTYNSDGELKKAPGFEDVDGFDKSENGLFEISTHVTPQGLIYVNFSSDPVPFDTWFEGMTEEMNEFDFSDYEYHMSYELDGKFNWKTLCDSYSECLHCQSAHPGLSAAFKINTYKVVPKTRYARHYAEIVREEKKPEPGKSSWFGKKNDTKVEEKKNIGGEFDGLWIYQFPIAGINCYSPAWYSIRILPISAKRTILQYDIYTKKGLDEASKKEFVDFLQQVEIEDYELCRLTQKNLNEGIYSTGYLHPEQENGLLFYQGLVKDMITEHFKLEQEKGEPIDPAAVGNHSSGEIEELDGICQSLECGKSSIDW